jgi:uncharacterized Ntn-hydrolase superfamily protein
LIEGSEAVVQAVPRLNTFSITARCARTGQFGIAVSTKVPAVGMLCPFAEAGVGAVATQSFVNPYLGIWGLDLLRAGASAEETLAILLRRDPDPERRQVAVVDSQGTAAAFSGSACDTWYGHRVHDNVAIAGNMLTGGDTLAAMDSAFAASQALPLAERLLGALAAGQQAGGDKRGRQSAALLVVDREAYPALSLRVDDHPDPVTELRRVYEVSQRDLVPLLRMLPTREAPGGMFDLAEARRQGLLQDGRQREGGPVPKGGCE